MEEVNHHRLSELGDFYPLDPCFKWDLLCPQLEACDDRWRPYNKFKPSIKREGLSLISQDGSDDGEKDLTSLLEYNSKHGTQFDELSFRQPTDNWNKIPLIGELIGPLIPHLGRSHFIRFGEGGFFPPHRDLSRCFRLIAFFNCTPSSLGFVLDDKKNLFRVQPPLLC